MKVITANDVHFQKYEKGSSKKESPDCSCKEIKDHLKANESNGIHVHVHGKKPSHAPIKDDFYNLSGLDAIPAYALGDGISHLFKHKRHHRKHHFDEMNSNANGKFLAKVKGLVNKVKGSGIVDSVGNIVNSNGSQNQGQGNQMPDPNAVPPAIIPTPPTPPAKTGMSLGLKIGIGVGAAVIIGLIIYKMSHKSGSAK